MGESHSALVYVNLGHFSLCISRICISAMTACNNGANWCYLWFILHKWRQLLLGNLSPDLTSPALPLRFLCYCTRHLCTWCSEEHQDQRHVLLKGPYNLVGAKRHRNCLKWNGKLEIWGYVSFKRLSVSSAGTKKSLRRDILHWYRVLWNTGVVF